MNEKDEERYIALIKKAYLLCRKFVDKVESGRARSVETYADCKDFLKEYEKLNESKS